MTRSPQQRPLVLPETLQAQLFGFRRRVWAIKLIEASAGAVLGVVAAFLLTFCLDRVWDTPAQVRFGAFLFAALGCALLPLALHRWVWRQRKLEQLARLLRRAHPRIGDQFLGIIELVNSEAEQARSLALCQAAVEQVARQAAASDFTGAVPRPKHRRLGVAAVGALGVGAGLLVLYPAAAANAWARFLLPWRATPRYTFAMIEHIPEPLIVAHGEPATLTVKLAETTASRPPQAAATIGVQAPVVAPLTDGHYVLELPAQIEAALLDLRVGDFAQRLELRPTLRPELTSVEAEVTLPAYLGRNGTMKVDVRGGALSLVNGSQATVRATATRELAGATLDGKPIPTRGATLTGPAATVQGNRQLAFAWQDQFGLSGKEPFVVAVSGRADEPPSVVCDGLPSRKVVLDTEHLAFKATARDDFGVKRVGIEWRSADPASGKSPAAGERLLAAGGPEQELLELAGTFTAATLGIEPQPIQVRLFVEDYLPGRARIYSPAYLLYILNAEQHAIWLTEQLNQWRRLSLDVRDKELQLFENNKQLRGLAAAELNQPDTRRRIETQAEAERANGRRLTNLVASGEDLVKQAMRNPQFGVGHLEKWAEMLQILKDIAGNRMPSVADLLKQAAQAPAIAANGPPKPAERMAGQVRLSATGQPPGDAKEKPSNAKPVPNVVDIESSQQALKPTDKPQPPSNAQGAPRLGLPNTLLAGGVKASAACPTGQKLDDAVTKQQDLLAEFDKIADELNRVLANLEGSTLVKRLKALARVQNRVAGRLGGPLNESFGAAPPPAGNALQQLFGELASQQARSSQDISHVMDDMQSYFERRRLMKFRVVLDDMLKQDVIGGLRQLGDDLHKENGLSIAQCEFWSDTLDRWAEDLVDPASGGS